MRKLTNEQKALQAWDYMQIQNVMGRHMYYHGAGKHGEELDDLWAQKHEVTWSGNFGVQVGMACVRENYATSHDKSNQLALERVIKLHPEIENKPENWGIGSLIAHTLTTPVIEIAEDGETAQGVWYSPGIVTETGPDGKPQPQYMWEKYGVDFVKEDGEWKIWHIHMYYDLAFPPGGDWTAPPPPPPPAPKTGQPAAPGRVYNAPPTYKYKGYSETTVPVIKPDLPKPYKKFKDVQPY